MRKGHIKLIEQAERQGFSDKEINIIRLSELPLDYLRVLVQMITYIREYYENAEEMLDACLSLAGCDDNPPWVFGDIIQTIYYDILKLRPAVDELSSSLFEIKPQEPIQV